MPPSAESVEQFRPCPMRDQAIIAWLREHNLTLKEALPKTLHEHGGHTLYSNVPKLKYLKERANAISNHTPMRAIFSLVE